MEHYSEHVLDSHQVSGHPPFDGHRVVVTEPSNRAAQFIMRRYHLTPHTADIIADLAGLGSEVRS